MNAELNPPQQAFSSDPMPLQPIKILVVEDNPINQKVIVQQLQSLGYLADIAVHGQAALDITEKKYYPIILMDCRLPKVDGYAATRIIRDREQRSNQPRTIIIALTASDDPEVREAAEQAGMDDFLMKPLRRETLAAAMERWEAVFTASEGPPSYLSEQTITRFIPEQLSISQLKSHVDIDRLSQLADRNWEFAQELLQLYLEDTQIQIQELQEAIEQAKRGLVTQLAHHLKGASANIGAYQIEQLVTQIERATTQQPEQLPVLQTSLWDAFSQMQALLQPHLTD